MLTNSAVKLKMEKIIFKNSNYIYILKRNHKLACYFIVAADILPAMLCLKNLTIFCLYLFLASPLHIEDACRKIRALRVLLKGFQ